MVDLGFLTFDQLLDEYFLREGIEDELTRRYGTRAAVLVTDFTGMVERTNAYGIGYALALAAAGQRAMAPAMTRQGGAQIKQVADTLFQVFDSPARALLAALDGQRELTAFNMGRVGHIGHPDRNEPIRGCMGLGYGDLLVIPGRDVFGPEVNRAFVLGEDVGRGGEILATEDFLRALGPPPVGVGAFRAPAEREQEGGFAFHVLSDYR